jgi:hypothetical protein
VSGGDDLGAAGRGVERFGQYLLCGCRGEGGLVARRSLGGPHEVDRGRAKLPPRPSTVDRGVVLPHVQFGVYADPAAARLLGLLAGEVRALGDARSAQRAHRSVVAVRPAQTNPS